jgi:hypothetical protein
MKLLLLAATATAQAPTGAAADLPLPAPVDPSLGDGALAAPPTMALAEGTRVLEFEEDLHVRNDIMLQGLAATSSVAFTVPRGWSLTSDPTAELRFDHSAALDPERSSLTIRLNDNPLASVALDETNVVDGRVFVRLPRKLLQPYNQLQVQVVQHVTDECEDPFDPSLWTRISRASTMLMRWEAAVETPDLLSFPYPLIDTRGYGAMELALVESGPLLKSELSGLSRLGLALGRLAGYRGVSVLPPVANVAALRSHGIAVGVYGNDPIVTSLLATPPATGEGVVAVVPAPHEPSLSVLVVAGGDEVGLEKAIAALVGQDRYPVLSGRAATVSEVKPAAVPPLGDEIRPVPRQDSFKLADIGVKDHTVRGYYAESVVVPLLLEGDAWPKGDGSLRLEYAHSALLDPRLSAIEVRLNGVVVRSRALDSGDEGPQSIVVELPHELLEPTSELEIAFHLFPVDFDPCHRVSDRQLWATVFASSQLDLARDHYAMLPDLSLLRHRWWPFSIESADGGAVVALGDTPGPDDASALLQLAAELGRTSPASDPRLDVVFGAGPDAVGDRNVITLADAGDTHAMYDGLVRSNRLSLTGDAERELASGGALLGARVGTPYGTVEATPPSASGKSVLVLRSMAAGGLLDATRAFVDPSRVAALAGNVSVLPAEGGARPVDVAPKKAVGELSLTSRARSWIGDTWASLGIALPLAVLAATFLIVSWARRRGGEP